MDSETFQKEGVKPIPLLGIFDIPYFFTESDVGEIDEYPFKRLSGGICYNCAIVKVEKWGYTHPRKALVYITDITKEHYT